MRRFALLAMLPFAALTIAAAPTPPAQGTSTQDNSSAQGTVASAAPAAKPAEKKICASHEVTGSRFPVKECHTADEWADIHQHGMDQLGLTTRAQNGLSSTH